MRALYRSMRALYGKYTREQVMGLGENEEVEKEGDVGVTTSCIRGWVWSSYLAVRVLIDDLCSMNNLWSHSL